MISKRIRWRRVFTVASLFLLLVFSGFLVTSRYFNQTTKAADYEFTSTDVNNSLGKNNYFLDGWEMSNQNALGRVAPLRNLKGGSVLVSNGFQLRFDNSPGGFNTPGHTNNPLFATVDTTDPTKDLTPQITDGTTHLSSLTLDNKSSITHTPLDFVWANNDNGLGVSQGFGLRWTGYYFSATGNPTLKFTSASDDGSKIEAYFNDGSSLSWHEVSSDWDVHSILLPRNPATVKSINYAAGTYLPVRISYYNAQKGYAGMTLFVYGADAKWYAPVAGAGSLVGNFYTGPDRTKYSEGLVADYYLDIPTIDWIYDESATTQICISIARRRGGISDKICQDIRLNGSHRSYSVTSQAATFSSVSPFSMREYYFSYIDSSYSHSFDSTGCSGFSLNTGYGNDANNLPNVTDFSGCSGLGTPFINSNGDKTDIFNRNIRYLDPNNTTQDWTGGGRSRLRLDVAGSLTISNGSAVDVSSAGWPGMPAQIGGFDALAATKRNGLGTGGGMASSQSDGHNCVAAGGSFGGLGSVSEPTGNSACDYNVLSGLRFGPSYGGLDDVEYLGSAGGNNIPNNGYNISFPGGGLVIINTGSLKVAPNANILASGGGMGDGRFGDNGGAGSGGGIHLTLNQPTDLVGDNPHVAANGNYDVANYGAGGGGRIFIEGNFATPNDSCPGNVVASAGSNQLGATDGTTLCRGFRYVAIKKSLSKYNLQPGDQTTVTLTFANPTGLPITFDDQFLNNGIDESGNYDFLKIVNPPAGCTLNNSDQNFATAIRCIGFKGSSLTYTLEYPPSPNKLLKIAVAGSLANDAKKISVKKTLSSSNLGAGSVLGVTLDVKNPLGQSDLSGQPGLPYELSDEIPSDGTGATPGTPIGKILGNLPAGCSLLQERLVSCRGLSDRKITYNLQVDGKIPKESYQQLFGGKATVTVRAVDGVTVLQQNFSREIQLPDGSDTKVLVASATPTANPPLLLWLPDKTEYNYDLVSAVSRQQLYHGSVVINGLRIDTEDALVFPRKQIIGDVYLNPDSSTSLQDYSSFGSHLGINTDLITAWKIEKGYTIDPKALSGWDTANMPRNQEMQKNFDRLQRSAADLMNNVTLLTNSNCAESKLQYPEGQVFQFGTLANPLYPFSSNLATFCPNTLLVNGPFDLGLDPEVAKNQFGAVDLSAATFGLLATGDITVTVPAGKILNMKAAVFTPGTITIKGDGGINFSGSLVANKITIDTKTAIIKYDSNLETTPPPGFNFLAPTNANTNY